MRGSMILYGTLTALMWMVIAGIVAIIRIRALKEREIKRLNELLNNVANNIDVVLVVYSYANKQVEYVSDSVRWLFGLDMQLVYQDVMHLFRRFRFAPEDELMVDFRKGNIGIFPQKEYEIMDVDSGEKKWVLLKIIPYDKERYLVIAHDKTMHHELSETLCVALAAMDKIEATNNKVVPAVEQQREELEELEKLEKLGELEEMQELEEPELTKKHTVFEEPEIAIDVQPVPEAANQNPRYAGVRILLVEDNELNMEVATEMLKNIGTEVDQARNGKEAVELFTASEEGYYDLVLMDIQMPVMNGNNATKAIRALERTDAKIVPIIAMTMFIFAEKIQESLDRGMDMYISKPLDEDKLINTIEKYVIKLCKERE